MKDNQISDNTIDLVLIFKVIWESRLKILKWGLISMIIGIIISFSLPKEWTSTVKIVTENNNKDNSVSGLGGVASFMGINGMFSSSGGGIKEVVYPIILKSSPFLQEFMSAKVPYEGDSILFKEYMIDKQKSAWWSYVMSAPSSFISLFKSDDNKGEGGFLLDPKNPSKEDRNFEENLANRITIINDKETSIFTVTVKMQDPTIAAIIADSVVCKLRRYMANYYTSKAQADLKLSQELLKDARQNYYDADIKYASMQDRNLNLISKEAASKVERLSDEKSIAYSVYQQLASQVEMSKIKLQELTPVATVIEPARVPIFPKSPNKKLITIAFAFIGMFIASLVVVFKYLITNKSSNE